MIILSVWPMGRLPEAMRAIELVRPQGVMFHSDPGTLARVTPSASALLRSRYPGIEVSLGAAFDFGNSLSDNLAPGSRELREHLRKLREARVGLAATARASRITRVCIDPEAKWKALRRGVYRPGFSPEDAADVSSELRRSLAADGATLEATSYDCPGLHGSFPWEAWDVDAWRPQVYAYPAEGPAIPGMGAARLRLHRAHWKVKRPHRLEGYAAAYKVTQVDSGIVADAFPTCAMWAVPSRVDNTGLRVAWALARLHDSGLRGPGRIRAFQSAKRLEVDGKLGSRSFAAIEAEHGLCPIPQG